MNGPRFVPGRDLCHRILTNRPNPAVMATTEPVEQPPAEDDGQIGRCEVAYCPSLATHHIRTTRGEGLDVCTAHLPGLRSTLVGPAVVKRLVDTDGAL